METLIVIPENEKQLSLLKSLLKEMRITFKSEKLSPRKFSPEFVENIKNAREEKEKEQLVTINPKKLWESI